MKFIKQNHDNSKYVDNIFVVSNAAKKDNDPSTINASIGSFYDDDKKLLTFQSVFNSFRSLSDIQLSAYSEGPKGNQKYIESLTKFVLEDKIKNVRMVATSGGTGAISLGVNLFLNEKDTILIPDVAWGNYQLICKENNLNVVTYDPYNIDEIIEKTNNLEKIFIIINSPCQNPCGNSFTYEQWKKLIDHLNGLDKEVIILNDVAYLDYANDVNSKRYFELFNDLNENVLVLIGYSCSKSFSFYGLRLGALFIINSNEELLNEIENQCAKHNRTVYSSVNNGAMITVSDVIDNHLEEYKKEKQESINLLKQRADSFIEEANIVGLDYYPYQEGFFITLRIKDNETRDILHQKLIENHIYTIKVNKGIRIGICAIKTSSINGLAEKIKNIING